jgi:hypothetical protein
MEKKNEENERMVEIAGYTFPADAQTLVAFLKSEGIDCYLRNEFTSQIMAGYADVGGARVEVLEKDAERAIQLMEEGGYAPHESTDDEEPQIVATKGWAGNIPLLRRLPVEWQLMVLLAMIAIIIGLMVFFSSYYSS